MTSALRRFVFALFAVALVASACGDDEADELRGFVREPAPDTTGVTLPAVDADGAESAYELRADDDGMLLVYFGYTGCPDVCPTTLADVRSALRDLGEDAERVDLAMATIDPDRDTPEVLSPYVQSFVDDAVALRTTDDAELRTATDVLGVQYGVETNDEGEIEVIHTGSLYAIDDQGRLLVTWPFGTPAEDMAADLDLLLDRTA